jgi:hypothetical protein
LNGYFEKEFPLCICHIIAGILITFEGILLLWRERKGDGGAGYISPSIATSYKILQFIVEMRTSRLIL